MDYKESWAPKNWCFRTVVLEKPLESHFWTARRFNLSILKEISPEYSLKGLMLKLKLQYFGCLIRRTDSSERPWRWQKLKAGGEGDNRGWDGWMPPLTQWTWVWVSSGSWWWQGCLACCSPWGRKESDTTEQLNWIEMIHNIAQFLSEFDLSEVANKGKGYFALSA